MHIWAAPVSDEPKNQKNSDTEYEENRNEHDVPTISLHLLKQNFDFDEH